ncbi:glycosyltransferase involved in cell wall biosynthesis [Paenibacillus sp. V4I9]|uniref:glycosyltransferase family 2 protein n=1 Tax=Paenibacillus sp. V4I9 TaxID=3042308 RepID=UPI002782CA6B|nr:glycosyltransferase [Paenibacillus sp. V4I9]MDQ0890937.1 glycosyltransferase involved in cell wall biosynthesis [Paenibacillus sp. V4I9]
MELFKALIHSNISTTEDLNNLIIKLQLSDGMRSENAFSARFFVFYPNGDKLCSVKKIPANGLFNIENISYAQGLYRDFSDLSAPHINGIYHGEDGYIYIVEEFLENKTTLFYAMEQGDLSNNESIEILNLLFNCIKMQPPIPFDQKVLDEDIKMCFNALELLELPEPTLKELKLKLDKLINDNIKSLTTNLLWTNRDMLTRNIILAENKPYITDFDLSRKTHFFWLDIYRCSHYSDIPVQELNLNMNVDEHLLQLLFHLNEITLQYKVLNTKAFIDSSKPHKQKVLEIINRTMGIWIEELKTSEPLIPITNGDPYLQLFWSINNEYTESNSTKLMVLEDGEVHQYVFDVPHIGQSIRLDPSNKQCLIEINKITISLLGNEIFEITRETNSEQFKVNNGLLQLENPSSFKVVSLNNDPQIMINLPEKTNDINSKMSITIEMSCTPDISSIIIDAFTVKSNELLKTNDELTQLESAYKAEKDNHINATKLLEESAVWLQKLETNLSEGNKNIISLQDELENSKKNEIDCLIELSQVKKEIGIIKNTVSWKITKPLRKLARLKNIARKLRDVLRVLVQKKFVLGLVPMNDLTEGIGGHQWASIGTDPHFQLHGEFPKGWVRIKWASYSNVNLPLKLYWDEGNGLSETNSHIFGYIQKGDKVVQNTFVFISPLALNLRLDTGEIETDFLLEPIEMYNATRIHVIIRSALFYIKQRGMTFVTIKSLLGKSWDVYKAQGFRGVWAKIKYSVIGGNSTTNSIDYQTWIIAQSITDNIKEDILKDMTNFTYKPLISVIVPVYNVDEIWLVKCIESVRNQLYTNWELCVADDASPKPHIREVLQKYEKLDERIMVVYREKNGHISEASNSALEIANGEFIALLDHDDELTIDALYENVKFLNKHLDADMIYSDEDKISMEGERHSPFFKPDWSPDTLLSQMYTCHLGVYRTSLIKKLGGFRKGFEGSQDYDLVLRVTEKTNRIYHIPKILYHWRSIPQSTASGGAAKSYTNDAGFRALEEAISRRNINGWVEPDPEVSNLYVVHHKLISNPLISIIIPTRNMTAILDTCIASIFDKTTYDNFEIIVVDNGSDDPTTIKLFQTWLQKEPIRFKVERIDIPFNYSRLNNIAVEKANGELILLLNNDIEVITPTWLDEMAAQAMRSEIGAVGAFLLYPDNTIQHAGIILGIGGIAGHSHKYFDSKDYGYFSRLRMVTNYSAVTAACLMIRKEVYVSVKGLDESLEVAFNDVDFCLRVGKTGLRNVWLPQVKLYHHESKSRGQENTPAKIARFNREIEFMQVRWGDKLLKDSFYNSNLTLDHEDFSLSFSFKKGM